MEDYLPDDSEIEPVPDSRPDSCIYRNSSKGTLTGGTDTLTGDKGSGNMCHQKPETSMSGKCAAPHVNSMSPETKWDWAVCLLKSVLACRPLTAVVFLLSLALGTVSGWFLSRLNGIEESLMNNEKQTEKNTTSVQDINKKLDQILTVLLRDHKP